MKSFLRLLFALLVLLATGPAANITWRGGADEFFDTTANWNLPDDIPPGTPVEELENFRRVPGSLDKAIITAGAGDAVRVRDTRTVNMLESTKPLVIENAGTLTALTTSSAGPEQQVMGPVEVLKGGRLQLNFAVDFTGEVVVEGGGTLAVPMPAQPDGESRSIVSRILTLRAPAGDTTVRTATFIGAYLAAGSTGLPADILWGSVQVNASQADWQFGSTGTVPASPSRLRLQGNLSDVTGVTEFAWQGEKLRIANSLVQRESVAPHLIHADTTLDFGASVLTGGNLIIFQGNLRVTGFEGNSIAAPVLYRNVAVTVEYELELLPGGGFSQGVVFGATHDANGVPQNFHTIGDGAHFKIEGLIRLKGLKLEGGTLEVATTSPNVPIPIGRAIATEGNEPTEWHLIRGVIAKGAGLQTLIVRDDSRIVIHPRTTGNLQLDVDIINHGGLAFTPEAAAADTFAGSFAQIINRADGTITLPGSGGFSLASGALVNEGTVQIAGPAEPREPPAEPARAQLTGTFVSVGGTTIVTGHTTFVVNDGIVDQNGTLALQTGASLEIGSGLQTEVTYPTGDDLAAAPTATVTIDRLFTLGTTGTMTFADDVSVQLLGFGDTQIGTASGLRLRKALEVPHLQLGGPAGATPSIFFTADFAGTGLIVTKTLAWFGGRFIGENGQDHSVLLAADSATDLRSTDDNPGASTGSLRCTVRQVGSMVVNTTHGFNGRLVNEPDANLLLQRCDGGLSALINNGSVVKNTDAAINLGSNAATTARHGGVMNVDEGTLNFINGFTLAAPVGTFSGTTLNLRGAQIENTSINGPGQTLLDQVHLSGTVNVNNAQIGDPVLPNSVPDALTTSANTTLNIRGSVVWKNGHIRPGSNSMIVVQQNARLTIATENDIGLFTFLDRGLIENFGTIDYFPDSTSPMVADSDVTLHNKPGGTLNVLTMPDSTATMLNIFPPRQINANTVSPMNLLNDGVVSAGEVVWRNATTARMIGWTMDTTGTNAGSRTDLTGLFNTPAPREGETALGAPAVPQLIVTQPVVINGGVMTVKNLRFTAEKDVTANGGQMLFDENAAGEFLAAATVRNAGALLDIATGSTLAVPNGLTLQNQGTLGGGGFITGNVNNPSGIISPGANEALDPFGTLAVQGNVTFGAGATFEVDVPVDITTLGDLLDVSGLATLGGTVAATPVGDTVDIDGDDFIPLLTFGSRNGTFSGFTSVPFGGGLNFQPAFQGSPEAFGVKLAGSGTGADLALSAAPPVPLAGKNFKLTLATKNNGPEAASSVALTVTLPGNVAFVSSKPAPTTQNGQVLTYNLAALNKNKTTPVALTLTAPAPDGTAFQINATVASANTPDPNAANNTLALDAISFPNTKATYRGLVQFDGAANASGLFVFSLTPKGALSAKFTFGGKVFSIGGKLSADGTFTKTQTVRGLGAVTLTITALDGESITGTLTVNGQEFDLDGARDDAFARDTPAPQAGRYTVLLDPTETTAGVPQGIGFATMTVSAKGAVKIVGTLADGTKFSYSSALDDDGEFPLFVALYQKLGFLAGDLVFREVANESSADGQPGWLKPSGFTTTVAFRASRHEPIAGQPILPGLTGAATATLSAGSLAADLVKALTIAVNDKVTPPADDPERFTLTIKRKTGLVSGRFTPPGATRPVKINGAVHRKSDRMGGFFLDPASGRLVVEPD